MDLAGRGGAVLVTVGSLLYMIIVLYFPPAPTEACLVQPWVNATKALHRWAQAVLNDCPTRVTPILGFDLNDNFGIQQGEVQVDDGIVGPHYPGHQNLAANTMRELKLQ